MLDQHNPYLLAGHDAALFKNGVLVEASRGLAGRRSRVGSRFRKPISLALISDSF
jgi:hypothetical protein